MQTSQTEELNHFQQEKIVGSIPSGLFVLTVHDTDSKEPQGFLASWVQQASFNPLMISLCIKEGRPGINHILEHEPFCLNIVSDRDDDYLKSLKNRSKENNPIADLDYELISGTGAIIHQAKSAMICKPLEITQPGDHYLITAEVIDGFTLNDKGSPKTYIRNSGTHY